MLSFFTILLKKLLNVFTTFSFFVIKPVFIDERNRFFWVRLSRKWRINSFPKFPIVFHNFCVRTGRIVFIFMQEIYANISLFVIGNPRLISSLSQKCVAKSRLRFFRKSFCNIFRIFGPNIFLFSRSMLFKNLLQEFINSFYPSIVKINFQKLKVERLFIKVIAISVLNGFCFLFFVMSFHYSKNHFVEVRNTLFKNRWLLKTLLSIC